MAGYPPASLCQHQRFIRWALRETPGGRPTKEPIHADGTRLSTSHLQNCSVWSDVQDVERGKKGGIGFVFTGGVFNADGLQLVGLDIDACRDPRIGQLTDWAGELLEQLGMPYHELSPSLSGLHIYGWVHPRQLRGLRNVIALPFPAAGNTNKRPEVQLFTVYGYMTMTMLAVPGMQGPQDVGELDLSYLIERFNAKSGGDGEAIALPSGEGPAPTLADIEQRVLQNRFGKELMRAEWHEVVPDKSASEAFHLLVSQVLDAANQHGIVAVQFLLEKTEWGKGNVDSRDPGKYTRETWVRKDVARAASRSNGKAKSALDMFTEQPPTAIAPPINLAEFVKKEEGTVRRKVDEYHIVEADIEAEEQGDLVYLPTGIPGLDEMIGGGLVLGSRVFINGAPDAWKTGFGVQLIDTYVNQGICCAILGADEERVDLRSRFLQRRGFSRKQCETRSDKALMQKTRALLRALPLLTFPRDVSIEEAAVRLHEYAKSLHPAPADWPEGKLWRPPCVLLIDSVQVAQKEDEVDEPTLYKNVTQRVRAIQAACARYRMLVISTSEMNRGAYKSKKRDEQSSDMSSAKESGAIEYAARVMFAVRHVPGTSDVIELRIAKNKHGRSHRDEEPGIFLRVDRERQALAEEKGFEPVDPKEAEKKLVRSAKQVEAALALCRVLMMRDKPLGVREACRQTELHHDVIGDARAWLRDVGALIETTSKSGKELMLVPDKLPPELADKVFL